MKKKIISLLTTLVMVVGLVGVMPVVSVGAYDHISYNTTELYQQYDKGCNICSIAVVALWSGQLTNASTAQSQVYKDNGYTVSVYFSTLDKYQLARDNNSISASKIYNYLQKGPVIIGNSSHYSVVVGYNGSTSSLSYSGFIVQDTKNIHGGSYKTNLSNWISTSGSVTTLRYYTGSKPTTPTPTPAWGNNYMNLGSDFYAYIINSKHWKHLTNDGSNVSIRSETGAANQVWHFVYQSDGYYKVYNCKDGKALDVYNIGSESGTNVGVCSPWDTSAQLWRIYGNNIAYYLKPKCSDCILDVNGGYSTDGTNVQIWEKNGSDAQIFSIYTLNTPSKPTISYSAKCTTVNFNWSSTSDTKHYNLRIFQGSTDCKSQWNLTTTSATVELSVGTYRAYVDSCNNFSYTKSNEITVTVSGHNYTTKVVAPTSTSQGYTLHTCTICGDSYKDNYTESIGHNYTSTITSEATCTTDGIIIYTCSTCGDTYSETIPATGHKSVTDKAQMATCEVDGKTEGSHCSVCGEIIKEQEIIPKLGHDYNISSTTPATCTTDGIITYICSTCGDTYNETIPAIGHKYEDIVHNPTCTEQGYTEHECSVCEDIYVDSYTEPIGHNYIEEVITPTEKEQGYTLHTCTICGDSYKDNYTNYKPTGILIGDINNDGKITTADVGLANAHAKGTRLLNDEQFKRGEMNNDGKITTADVGLINAYAKGTKEYS